MTVTEIIARLAERQAELERLGDIGTARAQMFLELHADVVVLAEIVAELERQRHTDVAVLAASLEALETRMDKFLAMFEPAGSA